MKHIFLILCAVLLSIASLPAEQLEVEWSRVLVQNSTQPLPSNYANFQSFTEFPATPLDGSRQVILYAEFSSSDQAILTDPVLVVGPIDYPTNIFINGNLIYRYGVHEGRYVSTSYTSKAIPMSESILQSGKNIILLQAFPRGELNSPESLYIASYARGTRSAFYRNFFGSTLITALSTIALVIGTYFIFLFITDPDHTRYYLYFALTCILFFAAYIEITFSYGAAAELLIKQASKIGFVLSLFFFIYFLIHYTGILKTFRKIKLGISIFAALTAAIFIFVPSKAALDAVFSYVNMLYFFPFLVLGMTLILINFIKHRKFESFMLILGISFVVAAAFHDIMYIVVIPGPPYAYLTAYGFTGLILSIFIVLSLRQASLRKVSKKQATDLISSFDKQSDLIDKVTNLIADLRDSSDILDTQISNSFQIINKSSSSAQEVHSQIEDKFETLKSVLHEVTKKIELNSEQIPKVVTEQSDIVKDVSSRIQEVSNHISSLYTASQDNDSAAQELKIISENSTVNLKNSRDSIKIINDNSRYIQEVLNAIQDITERTHVLSINAAIEAVRAGEMGRGFSVVAQEIRELSGNSKEQVESSFERIQQMIGSIEDSALASEALFTDLNKITNSIAMSAKLSEEINRRLAAQQSEAKIIEQDMQKLISSTNFVSKASKETQASDQEVLQLLNELQDTFTSISKLMSEQTAETANLHAAVEHIGMEVQKNLINVELLYKAVRN
jgi:methyl-accepting chemotaxis protein